MVLKVIELIGVSEKSFEAAVQNAVKRSTTTVKNITGVDVIGQSVKVKDGAISEYRVHLKAAFVVEDK